MSRTLYLLFTPSLCAAEPWTTLREAIAGGVDLVQWRTPQPDRDGALRCIEICGERSVPVIVNDHVELAARLGAYGAHVGQSDLPARRARRLLRPGQFLGVSTHELGQIARATADGADHVGFGPMFATATKGYATGQPDGALRAALEQSLVPVWPIGGINATNVSRLVREGARRAAVASAILRAPDPRRAAAELREALAGEADPAVPDV